MGFPRIAFVSVLAGVVFAQQPQTFEVASIKPSTGAGTETRRYPGGRFTATGVTLKALIQRAWDVKDFQVSGGPGWVNADRFDLEAKASTTGMVEGSSLAGMIQALLAERFKLEIHHEIREMPIYSLVVAKSGAKLTPTISTAQTWSKGNGSLTGTKVPMEMLAGDLLEAQLSRVVVDNTGIKGDFDIHLTWSPDNGAEQIGVSLFTAIQEQMGLKLESAKGPVDVIVIDRAERPSEN